MSLIRKFSKSKHKKNSKDSKEVGDPDDGGTQEENSESGKRSEIPSVKPLV
ncbi:hypothetical protein TcasGA2_TC004310 [Tribolium castaneum]|uniref:Uncharacterized protein n=1 Tax=Tribolium castaneum TaxID=7070 RepID=D6X123_TRICA|nr:hypothetical protein TcasGA2_TC004310 [Tribolium castaneum]